MTLSLAGAIVVGIAGIAALPPLANPETVFLDLIATYTNPWVGGILLAAVLAAIMSTADSQLLVASSSVTEDLYRALFRADAGDRTLLWMGRAATVGVALVAYALALRGGTVLNIVSYAWAGFGAAFGPAVVLSLYWSRMTSTGALAGMISGAGTVLAWEAWGPDAVYSMIPGVIVSAVCVLVFSRLGRFPSARDWSRLDDEMIELTATPPAGRS